MGKIKLGAILIVCFALWGFAMGWVSAEEIVLPIDGGVYHMISSPYMPVDRDPQVSLDDDLGPYDPTQWRFFRYGYYEDPENPGKYISKYFELKTEDWSDEQDFDFGRGYWIISRDSAEIGIQGEPVGKNWIILEHEGDDKGRGWNQIGNIFDYDFPIVNLYVARKSNPGNPVQLIDPINNDLTYVTLQEFENDSYIDIPTIGKSNLGVGKGYWLRVREGVGEDVYLGFVATRSSALSKEILLGEEFFARVAQQEGPPDPPPGMGGSLGSSSSGSGSGGCFIATAAYRGYDHPNVQLLRKFRDRYLVTSGFGRMFVNMYYRYSPTLAKFVANRKSLKAVIRFNLMPIVGISAIVSKMNMYGFLTILAFPILMGFFFLIKSGGGGGRCKPKFSSKSEIFQASSLFP
jgi:hypothetical protein